VIGSEDPKIALGLGLGLGGGGGVDRATERGDGALALVFPPDGATADSAPPGCRDDARLGWLGCRSCPSTVGPTAGAGEVDGEDGGDGSDVEVELEGAPSGTVAVGVEGEPPGSGSAAVEVSPCTPVATCPGSLAGPVSAPLLCGQDTEATTISARIGAARVKVLTAGGLLTRAARVRRQHAP